MFVGASRAVAGQALLKANPQCNIIISDDGLQHYALQRDVEIVLINSSLQFGNQLLLPAGPLREKLSRLQSVDAIVDSGRGEDFGNLFKDELPPVFNMQVQGENFESLDGSQPTQAAGCFTNKNIIAIAGIGNPERFFNKLSALGLQFESKVFADHYQFIAQDLTQFLGKTILMTEKDAVKCSALTTTDAWYLPITATINDSSQVSLITLILQKLGI
jgi:tetraacyldisaccharide 4'-kinase